MRKITPAGRKVFMLQYRTNAGERRKPAIGLYGELTVEQARRSRRPVQRPRGRAVRAPASTFGRGRVASRLAGRTLGADARRVIIKSRFVVLKKAGANSVSTHLRYIERDGVTRDGERGQAYGAETDTADLKTFEERGKGDRHQFRFIVSVEDAEELEDLRGYPRNGEPTLADAKRASTTSRQRTLANLRRWRCEFGDRPIIASQL